MEQMRNLNEVVDSLHRDVKEVKEPFNYEFHIMRILPSVPLPLSERSMNLLNEPVESVESGESQKKWEERSCFWVLKGQQVLRRENRQIALRRRFEGEQLVLHVHLIH